MILRDKRTYWGIIPVIIIAYLTFQLGYNEALGFDCYISDEQWYVSAARNMLKTMFHVNNIAWYQYPQAEGIESYLNLEHPPLGKYIIMLAMITLGDKPIYWRIPNLIEAAIMIILVYLIARKITKSELLALVPPLILFLDPLFNNMKIIAMLDFPQAFFTLLAVFFMVYDKPLLASIMIGLASSIKHSGVFLIPGYAVYLYFKQDISKIRSLIYTFIVPSLVFTIVNIPVIIYLGGIKEWIDIQLWALSWHASYKNNPFIVPPWGWLINQEPFVFYYSPEGTPLLSAKTNPYLYPLIIPTLIIALLMYKEWFDLFKVHVMLWSYYIMYYVLYAIGGRSQLSFYAMPMAPLVSIVVPLTLVKTVLEYEKLSEKLRNLVKRLKRKQEVIPESLVTSENTSITEKSRQNHEE